MCSRKGRAKEVQKFISPYLTEVFDAYGEEGKLKYQEPVSHETELIIAAILAARGELFAQQQDVLDAIDAQNEYLQEQTKLLRQILKNQSGG